MLFASPDASPCLLQRCSPKRSDPRGTKVDAGIAQGRSLRGCSGQGLLVPVRGRLSTLPPSSHISCVVKGDFHSIGGRSRCLRPEFLRVSSAVYGASAYESFLYGQRTDPKRQAFFFFPVLTIFIFGCDHISHLGLQSQGY